MADVAGLWSAIRIDEYRRQAVVVVVANDERSFVDQRESFGLFLVPSQPIQIEQQAFSQGPHRCPIRAVDRMAQNAGAFQVGAGGVIEFSRGIGIDEKQAIENPSIRTGTCFDDN